MIKKQYQKPAITAVSIGQQSILCSSCSSNDHRCNQWCRIWHTCRDRNPGTTCYDKKIMIDMSEKDKELLLKDLCARLPYNVNVDITYSKEHGSSDRLRICSEGCLILNTDVLGLYIEDEIYLKPYLRPMSSMTEEEKSELGKISCEGNIEHKYGIFYRSQDYLNSIHVDYRGLIEKGLALEAPKGMYNVKEK